MIIYLLALLSCSREAEQYDIQWLVSSAATEGLDKAENNLLSVVATANKNIGWDNNQELPILDMVSKYILEAVQ